MLVFCEDCGEKHTVDEHDVADETFELRCDACGFLITAKSLPKPQVVKKIVDPTMELTCSHDVLEFGVVNGAERKMQTLILAANDGRKVELVAKLDSKLKGNVEISSVSGMAFRVEVVAASNVTGSCLNKYQGPGVLITDIISNFQKKVTLSFSRD